MTDTQEFAQEIETREAQEFPGYFDLADAAIALGIHPVAVGRRVRRSPERYGAVQVRTRNRLMARHASRIVMRDRWKWLIAPAGVELLRTEIRRRNVK